MTKNRRQLIVKLGDILKERNMTQIELKELTDLRPAAISEIVNNQRRSINRDHLERIADALDITDINELIELVPQSRADKCD